MSDSSGTSGPPEEPDRSDQQRRSGATALQNTPNAERYLLEADVMRRRQLRSALLHGSRRTWREHRRVWPAVVVGLIVVAVILAGLAVTEAFDATQENQREQEREMEQRREQEPTPPPQPSPSPSPAPGDGSPTGPGGDGGG